MDALTVWQTALTEEEDWRLVVDCLHWSGNRYKSMPDGVAIQCWTLADGFGRCSLDHIANTLEWDWSHIRDSSTNAIAEIADYIRTQMPKFPELVRP